MSAESTLGTAHAEIVVDLTKMTGDITRAKTLVSSLGPTFEGNPPIFGMSQK